MEQVEKCVLDYHKIVESSYKLHALSSMLLFLMSELSFPEVHILYVLSISDWPNHDESVLLSRRTITGHVNQAVPSHLPDVYFFE